VDKAVGQLLDGLSKRKLWSDENGPADELTLIIVADHGMAKVSIERVIVLEDLGVPVDAVTLIETSPVALIVPANESIADVVFSKLNGSHPNLHVSRKSDMPLRLHYSRNIRIPEIVAWVDVGWSIVSTRSQIATHSGGFSGGTHGYDNASPEMNAVFIGVGNIFANRGSNLKHVVENVHLYETLAKIIGITPELNNGTLSGGKSGFGLK